MISIQPFTFNQFQENTFVLFDETKEAIIIDPGCYSTQEKEVLKAFIKQNDLKVVRLINTHCHIDHVLGNKFVKDTYNVKLEAHRIESEQLNQVPLYAPSYGFGGYDATTVDIFIDEKTDITFGNSTLKTLFVPGHSPGHLAFYSAEQKFCVSGDVLFFQSIGRTDLPGGSMEVLRDTIRNIMYKLPEDTKIYCGHGNPTMIAFEKKNNHFIREV